MSIRKHNEFLDDAQSDDQLDDGYDSEAAEASRAAIAGRSSKRRKLDDDTSSVEDELDDGEEEEKGLGLGGVGEVEHVEDLATAPIQETTFDSADEDDAVLPAKVAKQKATALKQVAAAEKAARKSGVVYISRVPPFMKPQTLKHFLAPHAPKGLGRIFLTPEDHAAHTRRVKNGGNKKKSFTDGWVEFTSKGEAKLAAERLNGELMGGKKGNFYHDDLWNIKYLTGFKWSHLTEQIAGENAERAARLREEIRRTRRENKAFVDDVERGKMLDGMELKRKAKGGGGGAVGENPGREKRFKQKMPELSRRKEDKAFQQRPGMSDLLVG